MKELLGGLKVIEARGIDILVRGVHYDSRQVKPGFIFVCIKGFRTDGHNYIDDAISKGANAVVIEKDVFIPPGIAHVRVDDTRLALALLAANFYSHPSRELNLYGVTGTNGKTTTTHLIEAVLRSNGEKTGIIGTVYNRIGDIVTPVTHTTPESVELQALLRKMVDSKISAVAMEVSSHGLVLNRLAGCEFDVGVFTNLTRDHLDFHKTLEDYLAAKMILFKNLGKERKKKRPCYAVVNLDDPFAQKIIKETKVPVVTYAIREKAEVKAEDVKLTSRGISFNVVYKKEIIPFSLSLLGEFNVYNSLAAISIGLMEGIPVPLIQKALKNLRGVPGRFELINLGQSFTVVVDYAHTPDGLENILRTSRTLTCGKIITVFGCGGDRDAGKRPLMGKISGEISDVTVVTSDNPRTEDPEQIMFQIETGLKQVKGAKYFLIKDRYEAIRFALQLALPGDFVVIAGKGHESYQIIGNRVIPFDDRLVVREILEKEIL